MDFRQRENGKVSKSFDLHQPRGKIHGRIFRLSAPRAPTTDPDNTKEQEVFLSTLMDQQRVSGAHRTMLSWH